MATKADLYILRNQISKFLYDPTPEQSAQRDKMWDEGRFEESMETTKKMEAHLDYVEKQIEAIEAAEPEIGEKIATNVLLNLPWGRAAKGAGLGSLLGMAEEEIEAPGITSMIAKTPTTGERQATPKYLYHVTFTENIPNIEEKGLEQFHTSNWIKGPEGERYNKEAGIFAFDHPQDAITWAAKMEWEFRDDDSDIAIVRLAMQEGEEVWGDDPSEDISLARSGKSLRSRRNIKADKIIDAFKMKDFSKPGALNISQEKWRAQIEEKLLSEPTPTTEELTKGDRALNKAIEKEIKKDPSFDDKIQYYNYLTIEKGLTNPKEIAKKMKAFLPRKPTKMRGGGYVEAPIKGRRRDI